MKPARDIETLVRGLSRREETEARDRILGHLIELLRQRKEQKPAAAQPDTGRRLMNNPIARLGIAAAVVAVALVGLSQFGGPPAGVAWGEVARKVEASRGVVVRVTETSSMSLSDDDYSIKYFTPTHSRTDSYKDGQIVRTFYSDSEKKIATAVFHPHKHYIARQITTSAEGFLERDEDWMNPRYLVQRILSAEHNELGRKTIEGAVCEGLDTTDPAVLGPLPGPITRLELHMQLWVDAETEYPVRFEARMAAEAEGETLESEGVMDQFQWDVELDPELFEPNVPPDYEDMRNL
jgi:hypothetical protein